MNRGKNHFVIVVCLFQKPCRYQKKYRLTNHAKIRNPIPICAFPDRCNQQFYTTPFCYSQQFDGSIQKIREARFGCVEAFFR